MARGDIGRGHSEGYNRVVPQEGMRTVANLVNFSEPEGAFGRADSGLQRTIKLLGFGVGYILVCVLVGLIIKNLFVSLLFWILLFPVPFKLISLFVFKESQVRREYLARQKQREEGNQLPFNILLGVYEIRDTYPHILYYRDGSVGIVLKLVRKASVGDVLHNSFEHGQDLGLFYQQALDNGISVESLDLQSVTEADGRFKILYDHLDTISNPTLEKVMNSIYINLEINNVSSRLTQEYFLLRGSGSEVLFWENVQYLMSILTDSAYRRVSVLGVDEVADVLSALYGLTRFPIREGFSSVVQSTGTFKLTVLWVGDAEGRRKVLVEGRTVDSNVSEDTVTEIDEGTQNEETLIELGRTRRGALTNKSTREIFKEQGVNVEDPTLINKSRSGGVALDLGRRKTEQEEKATTIDLGRQRR